jgi:Na+/phosphate symporter
MDIIWKSKTTKFQKPFLFPQLVLKDPQFQVEQTKTEVPFITNTSPLVNLLNRDDSERFRTRWDKLQARFVDDPRSAIREADGLVVEIVEKITRMSADQNPVLEDQMIQGNDLSTEDLRHALQHYRSFFDRLVV